MNASQRTKAILVAVDDPVLHPEAMHIAAATGRPIVDSTDPGDINRHLNRVSAVLVDGEIATTITNDRRRDRIFLLASDPGPPDFKLAMDIHAEQALLLPAHTGELLTALGREDGTQTASRRHPGSTIGVLGAAGGVGVSTIAAALARRRTRKNRTVLIDAVASSGGLDLLLGLEDTPGARWPDLGFTRGTVQAEDVLAALPVTGEKLFLLSAARSAALDFFALGAGDVTAAVACLAAADEPLDVVVDLRAGDIADEVVPVLDHLVLVVSAEVRAVAAAVSQRLELQRHQVPVSVVLRHRGWSGLDVAEVENIIGAPVIAEVGTISRLPRAVEMHGLIEPLPKALVAVAEAISAELGAGV
ncbi:septum site-determining protein Ssd [uncultured Corynebacterium sp.]|uniref:septum site-determining protein Ssd n=1 Tax=uncultured Corynebacterium sp. TaxID=159447 RepID=UPI0026009880|nr:septum site-determining protein Ssd [uncultured Corynebacterium sp.]